MLLPVVNWFRGDWVIAKGVFVFVVVVGSCLLVTGINGIACWRTHCT